MRNETLENGSTCDDTPYFGATYIGIMTSVLIILWTVGVTVNGTVLLSIVCIRRLRTTTNFLVANLAVIGFLYYVSIVSLAVWIVIQAGVWPDSIPCYLNGFLLVVLTSVAWMSHAAVSVERYVKIKYPLQRIFSRCVTILVLLVVWLCSICIALLPNLSKQSYFEMKARIICAPDFNVVPSYFMIAYTGSMFVSVVIMVVCQAGVYRIFRRSQRRASERRQIVGVFTTSQETEERRVISGNNSAQMSSNRVSMLSDVVSIAHSKASYSHENGSTRPDFKMTLAIFKSSILYVVVYIAGIAAIIVSRTVGPIDENACNVEGYTTFYVVSAHMVLVSLVMAVTPIICIQGHTGLRSAVRISVRKLLRQSVSEDSDS